MSARFALTCLLATVLALPAAAQPLPPRPGTTRNIAAACTGIDPSNEKSWIKPAPPARLFGNTYYVGTCGITALLVETPTGLVLIDGGLAEAAPLVLDNIRQLGFSPRMVRWILVSHEHYDHAGALAVIQRETGARVIASSAQLRSLQTGRPDPEDAQAPMIASHPMAPLRVDTVLPDGARHTVGGVSFTLIATPAHSPGSTSWTWRDCEGAVCRTIAYADSVTVFAPEGFRFTDHPARLAAIKAGLRKVAALPCDILVTPHPFASDLFPRMSGAKPLAQFGACRDYADAAAHKFEERLSSETNGTSLAK